MPNEANQPAFLPLENQKQFNQTTISRYLGYLLLSVAILVPALHAAVVTPLHEGWRLQSACKMEANGAAISNAGFSTEGWIHATVPSTVLAAQVAAGIFPDPYFGDNLRKIPGTSYPIGENFSNLPMPQDSPYHCGWWYRDEFTVAARAPHRQYWLHFAGINYRADIWLNGRRIADSSRIAGAYRTYNLDITGAIQPGKPNTLAIEVFAPTEKDLGINWVDWNPMPPDKDMGLFREVDVVTTGPVALRSPMAATHLEGAAADTADLTVYAEIENATNATIEGTVFGSAAGADFQQQVTLAPHEERTVSFTPDKFPQLRIHHPALWWPRQMGNPHLEHLVMGFRTGGQISDEQKVNFGIREITSELTARGARQFRINGKPILIRGGGWAEDMLLRESPSRLRRQFELVRDLNLNTIRLEGKLETEDFYDLADQNGVLIMAGWCCCDHWERWKTWTPEDLAVATASVRSQMLRLRSHPSLLVWLNGSDNAPPLNVRDAYLKVEAEEHWPNPTIAGASSAPEPPAGETGVKMTGPYDYVEPSYWYVDQMHGGHHGFNTETSPGPAIPSLASRKMFLSDPDAWPASAAWKLHYGGGGFTTLDVLDHAMNAIFAKPDSREEYDRLAETMEYASERAMFESYSGNKYVSTGVIQWMLNNAWPSMIWHLYDYYLDPDANYYGVKKACEPLHIQYSYGSDAVVVVNSTYQAVSGLEAAVEVHGIHWNELFRAKAAVDLAPDGSQMVFKLPESLFSGMERIFLIDLTLKDSTGRVVSRNFYWVPYTDATFDWFATTYTHTPAERYPDLTALMHLPPARVEAHAEFVNTARGREVRLQLENSSDALAFQIKALLRTPSGDLVAPVMWSDNWIELVPGESRTLSAMLPKDAPKDIAVKLSGWNVPAATLTPTSSTAPHP